MSQKYIQDQGREMTKGQKVQVFFLLLTLVLIFSQSAMPPDLSSSESRFVTRLLMPILKHLSFLGIHPQVLVRKAGHFVEYCLLGLQMVWFVRSRRQTAAPKDGIEPGKRPGFFWRSLLLCFLIAFLDETIQIFSGRGPAIQDVWLDLSGALFGMILFLLAKSVNPYRS